MAVKWTKIDETTTAGVMPTNAAVNASWGINAPGGPVEFLMLQYTDLLFAATPCANNEISALISNLRVVLNGEIIHSFDAGYANNAATQVPQYNALLNSIGGRCVERPDQAAPAKRSGFMMIPLGRQTPAGVNRYEIFVDWSAAAAAFTSGKISWWLKFNDNMQTTTTVVPSTSYITGGASVDQVTVRVPQNVPGVVSALMVTNDTEADELNSVRINALSDFGVGPMQYRAINGNLQNGMQFNAGSQDPNDLQQFANIAKGSLVIPVYGLSGGDLVLTVDSTAGTTRRYIPIMTNPVGAKAKPDVRQTQASIGNTAKDILKGSLQ